MKNISLLMILYFSISYNVFSQTEQEDYKNAVEYFKKANEYKQNYDFENSKLYFEKAALLFKKYEHYTGNYIQCRFSTADICIQGNKFESAETILAEIEELSISKFGENNKFLTNILYGKGMVLASKGKHTEAISVYEKSLELLNSSEQANLFLQSNLAANLGNSYSELGKLDLALNYYQKDLDIKEEIFGDNNPILAIAYNNISNIYIAKAKYKDAMQFIDDALKLSVGAYGQNDVRTAKLYNSKGNIYKEIGQYELALEYYQKSLDIYKSNYGLKHISVEKNLNDIGIIYNKLGNFDKALIFFKDAYDIQIDIFGENHPDIAGTCNNIGYILEYQNKHESSLKFYQNAINIQIHNFGDNHPELAVYYNNIGINYYNRKEYEKSLEYYLKAIQIIESNYGNKFPGIVRIYLNTADLYKKLSDFQNALIYYQKSIIANISDFNVTSEDYMTNPPIRNYLDINKLLYSFQGKAGVLEAVYLKDSVKNYLEFAGETYILCDSVIAIARKQSLKEEDKINLGNQTKIIYESIITVFFQLAEIADSEKKKQSFLEQMFYFAEKNKAIILSQAVSSSNVKEFSKLPPEILQKEHDLKSEISEIEKTLAESSEEKNAEILRQHLFNLNEELRSFNSEIEKNYPKYFNSKYKDTEFKIAQIQNSLDQNSAVRSYFIGEDDIIIFTLTNNEIKVTSTQKPSDFDEKVKSFNTYITSGYKSDFELYLKQANEFYNLFFPDNISEKIQKLTIIPDGLIALIPFEALITDPFNGDVTDYKSYPFLIKKYELNYSYSAGLLINIMNSKSKNNNQTDWFGIAPVFSDVSEMSINKINVTPLPGSKNEIKEIETLFNNHKKTSTSIIEKNATETNFKSQNLKDYKYIHIATHGIVDTYEPKLSGILFFPTDSENDGVLFSGEIYNLELDADLVVLSACETGIGKISKSEGVIGLSRALIYAGSKNTIVSLWKVSDESTRNLMVNFYTTLLEDENNKAHALHLAKTKMIEEGGTFAHPFFWSPFILIGK